MLQIFRVGPYSIYFWSNKNNPLWIQNVFWNYRKDVTAGKIFVTVFLDFKTYKKLSEELTWDTEVWISEMPNHMIHLNGDKFMGTR